MKKKVISGLLSAMMVLSLMTGCGGSTAPSGASAESTAEEKAAENENEAIESVGSIADSAVTAEDISEPDTAQIEENSFTKRVSTIMAEHGRPSGDLIVDLKAPEPEELTEEEGAEMDRAMRAYTPSIGSLLVNNAKNFYYYNKLDEDQKAIYDTILMISEDPTDTNNIAAFSLYQKPDDKFYSDVISPAYYALMYDHPELFWLYSNTNNYLAIGDFTNNGESILYIGFSEPYKNFEKDMKAFNDAATNFLKDIDLKKSDLEIADAIHDKLIDMVSYDETVLEKNISDDLAHSAYGALVANSRGDKNTCVCDGYSLAYVYLCQQAGLEAVFLCGMAGDDQATAGGHAWSIVKIDGKWREVDSCWDDWDDVFEAFEKECSGKNDSDSKKIMMALSDKDFQKALEHYLDRVTTEYITNFNDIEPFIYVYDDDTALVLVDESVHIRMDKVKDGGVDSILMKMAPIAE